MITRQLERRRPCSAARPAGRPRRPTISVYTTCRNGGRYLGDTLESIFCQSLADFEIVLVDGASTDGTLDLLRSFGRDPRLRWVSEPDGGPGEGFCKALRLTQGRYVMCLPVSDRYLSPTWFEQCVAVLERDPEVSMVHGNVMRLGSSGEPIAPLHPTWSDRQPPCKYDYFAYWLATFMHASEITYCVRSDVYRSCYPPYPSHAADYRDLTDPLGEPELARYGPHMKCLYNFHRQGYLASYLPVMAAGARENSDNLTTERKRYLMMEARKYTADIVAYRQEILDERVTHLARDGRGQVIRAFKGTELAGLVEQVAAYRRSERLMFDAVDEANVYHRERAGLFRRRWQSWAVAFGPTCPIAIYGGGMHTEQLLEILGDDLSALNVVAIVDRRDPRDERMRGIPVVQTSAFDFGRVEHVIVSSKAHQEEICRQLLEVVPASKLERIYRQPSS